jgi:hypothetical protein
MGEHEEKREWGLNLTFEDSKRARAVIEDTIGPVTTWPIKLANLFGSRHLKMSERFELTNFLLCNGVHGDWVMAHYKNQTCLRDDAANRDIQTMWERYRTSGKVFTDSCLAKGDLHFYHDMVLGHECLAEPFDVDRHCWAIYKLLEVQPREFRIKLVCKVMHSAPRQVELHRFDVANFVKDVDRILMGREARATRKRVYCILHEIAIQHCRVTPRAEALVNHLCCA